MAEPMNFKQANTTFRGGEDVDDIVVLRNINPRYGCTQLISAWKLSEKELEQVNKTGVIYVCTLGEGFAPMIVSTELGDC